ncbi:hypothetical protein T484DRAFT_1876895, partial [Baffinella frigidus]
RVVDGVSEAVVLTSRHHDGDRNFLGRGAAPGPPRPGAPQPPSGVRGVWAVPSRRGVDRARPQRRADAVDARVHRLAGWHAPPRGRCPRRTDARFGRHGRGLGVRGGQLGSRGRRWDWGAGHSESSGAPHAGGAVPLDVRGARFPPLLLPPAV